LNPLGACFFNLILVRREMYVRMGMSFVEKVRGGGNRKGRTELCGEGGIGKAEQRMRMACAGRGIGKAE
jgi:hypothetical protein